MKGGFLQSCSRLPTSACREVGGTSLRGSTAQTLSLVRKTPCSYDTRTFCQDRLGTNAWKKYENNERFSAGKIADVYMKNMCEDFGCEDHW
jgi:hypothetical protein